MSEEKRSFGSMARVLAGLVIGLSMVSTGVFAEEAGSSNENILDRIKPLGVVATSAAEAEKANPSKEEPALVVASGPMSAEKVFNTACMACHATGAAGAPKMGDTAAWAPRIAQGMDVLFEHATKGFKAMPPRGGSAQLSDKEVQSAITFMVDNSK